jgi:hypothetical protein
LDWITEEVAIGNYREAQNAALLEQHAFRSVVSLDGTLSFGQAAEFGLFEVASYRLIDGAGNDLRVFRFAINDLLRHRSQHHSCLRQVCPLLGPIRLDHTGCWRGLGRFGNVLQHLASLQSMT